MCTLSSRKGSRSKFSQNVWTKLIEAASIWKEIDIPLHDKRYYFAKAHDLISGFGDSSNTDFSQPDVYHSPFPTPTFPTLDISHTGLFLHMTFHTPDFSHTGHFPHPSFPTPDFSHTGHFPHRLFPHQTFPILDLCGKVRCGKSQV